MRFEPIPALLTPPSTEAKRRHSTAASAVRLPVLTRAAIGKWPQNKRVTRPSVAVIAYCAPTNMNKTLIPGQIHGACERSSLISMAIHTLRLLALNPIPSPIPPPPYMVLLVDSCAFAQCHTSDVDRDGSPESHGEDCSHPYPSDSILERTGTYQPSAAATLDGCAIVPLCSLLSS